MTQKIAVCILTPSHYSSSMGGAEYQAHLLTDALCRTNKYSLFYVCRWVNKNYIPQGYQIRVVNNGTRSNRLSFFSDAVAFYKELKIIKPSIIFQKVGGLQTGVAGYYAKKHGAKFIWHVSSDDDISPQWKTNLKRVLSTIPERIFLNYGIKNATIIASQTKYQADLLKKKIQYQLSGLYSRRTPIPQRASSQDGCTDIGTVDSQFQTS